LLIVKLLLDKRADVNVHDKSGETALSLAVERGQYRTVQLLLANGSQPGKDQDAAGLLLTARTNALLMLVGGGDVTQARTLLEEGADANARSKDGKPVLLLAVEGYGEAIVPLLVAKGADVDATDSAGQTALMVAADKYSIEVVKLLLAHGAKINASDEEGNTALFRVLGSFTAHREPDIPQVPLFLANGAEVNVKNRKGTTPLMVAARHGHPALPLLLAKGAEVNARDAAGNTALFYAFQDELLTSETYQAALSLLGKGADVNIA